MKKGLFVGGVFFLAFLWSTPLWAGPMTVRLANVAPVGDPRDMACVKFSELVKEKTQGNVVVEVFSGGTLGDWRVTIEGLKPGIVNAVIESIGTLEPYTKLAGIDPFPYLYRDFEHFKKVWYSETGDQLLKKIGDAGGFRLIGPMYRGARYVTSKKKFSSLEELRGLKIRAPQLKMYLKTWELLGAAPTPMAATEIYTGLQQGTVDAQENPLDFCYSYALYELCPFLIETRHVLSNDVFIFDKAYFEALPEEVQRALIEAANEVAQWRTAYSEEQEQEYIQKFREKNVEVVAIDTAPLRERVSEIVELFPDLKDLVEEVNAVR